MTVEYEYDHEGVILKGRLALPDGDDVRPGVVVFHEVLGLGRHTDERANDLADAGYVGLAADMYGPDRGEFGSALSVEHAQALMSPLLEDPNHLRARAHAAIEAISEHPRCDRKQIAVIGYCFGGIVALELARRDVPIALAASFHGVLSTSAPAEPGQVSARILVCTGSEDIHTSAEQRAAFEAEFTRAEAQWQLVVFGGVKHGYTNRDVDALGLDDFRYDEVADRMSWATLLNHLDEVFRSTTPVRS